MRRAVFALAALLFGLLSLFPQQYRAAVTMTPTDPSSLGLSGALGQLGAINNVFGNQTAIEVALKVAKSIYVRHIVIQQFGLEKKLGLHSEAQADRWLTEKIGARALRGGIIELEYVGDDPEFGRGLISTYADALRKRLSEISREQTAYKRDILIQLVGDASDRLANAQANYDSFRLRTRYSEPTGAIRAIGDRIPALQEEIRLKQVRLSAARQFYTDDNMNIRPILAEIAALKGQLSALQATSARQSNTVTTLGNVVRETTTGQKLERELALAQSLYDAYKRYLQGTAVEDLTSTANARILEPPFVDTARQYNMIALGLFILTVLAAIGMEFYFMAPPVGLKDASRVNAN
jgi:uncharacterized protein involved in exopolysaccharide biosynthesis